MVVCTSPMIRMAPAPCPITPVTIHPYTCTPTGLCAIRTIACSTQRYPTVLPNGQILSAGVPLPPPGPLTPPDSPNGDAPPLILTAQMVPYNVVYGKPGLCQSPSCQQRVVACLPGPEVCPAPRPVVPQTEYSLPVQPNLCSVTAAPSWKQSYGMEQVWQNEFKNLFSHYAPHNWMLLPIIQKPIGIWNANVDSAKVRFCCEDCGHGWTSMKGRVAFWFVLNPANGEGMVCLKLYGQQCDRCKTGNYEPAMWYPEEVLKVLVNIYNRVGQVYYGFQQAPYHRVRRAGKPRTPHNSDLCQACKDGVCSERR